MQGSEIEILIEACQVPDFKGVYTVQSIPQLKEKEFVIFNLSAELPGTHWAYLILDSIDETGHCHYQLMDSLGAKSSFVKDNFNSINAAYVYNTFPVQPETSNKCGLYCVYFAIIKSENEDIDDFFELLSDSFSSDLNKNDEIVISFLTQYESFF